MSVLRFDATTQDWVVFAPERARRPGSGAIPGAEVRDQPACPFCPGQEHLTPPALLTVPGPDGMGWKVRVVPNKFAVLRPGETGRHRDNGLFGETLGYGAHEVVIESPEHSLSLSEQALPQVERVLRAIRERFLVLMSDPLIRSIVVFKNQGEAAGTSLRHPHWQIVATPVVPRMHRMRHIIAQDYFDITDRCLYCDLLAFELSLGTRLISSNDGFAAIAPFASHLPYQVRIMPRRHASAFSEITEAELPQLADMLQRVLYALRVGLEDPPFNLTLNTAPIGDEAKRYFLWHLDVLPRLSTPAGFEMGSGMSVNAVLPEDAAEKLRAVVLPNRP